MAYFRPTSRVWRRQALTVLLLLVAYIVAYMDRSALSIATPEVRKEFGLNIAQMGVLLSVFPWAYGLLQLLSGPLVDRAGPRLLTGLGVALWSLVQAAAGLVGSVGQLLTARIALGVAESPLSPATVRALRTWFRPEDRGLAISICFSGAALGPAIAPPILTELMLRWGWRAMFVVVGLAGIVLASLWWAAYRDPSQSRFSKLEEAELPEETTPLSSRMGVSQAMRLFRFRTFWGMVLGNFGLVYLAWLYITWLPGYLEIERHMSVRRAGIFAGIPQLAGLVGFWSGGWIGDRLLRSGISQQNSRKIPIIGGLLAMAAATIPAALVKDNGLAIAFISIAVFFGSMSQPAQWALVSLVAPPKQISTFSGFTNFGGALGGSLSAAVTGYIAQTHGFAPGLILGGLVAIAAALIYGVMVHRPIEAEETDDETLSQLGRQY
jgi:sugar phosphate permease